MASSLKTSIKLFIAAVIAAVSCQLSASSCFAQTQRSIRVSIIKDAESLNLKINGPYEITDAKAGRLLYKGVNLRTTAAGFKGGIIFGASQTSNSRIFIKTGPAGSTVINGRRFKGDIELIKKEAARLLVVNYIELEDYVKGILYHEVSHYWPIGVLQAQAIVSRTYAVYQCEENKSKDFDVTNDIYSQVYGGFASERSRTNKAVEDTTGKILSYQNKIIPAFFHSTCGGHTEDASLLWNIKIPPLKGVPCEFCKDSPHFSWYYVVFSGEARERLVNAGYKIGVIKEIVPLGRDSSGRITDLKVVSLKKEINISAKDFRNIIGPNDVRSTNFEVKVVNTDVIFEGTGWGHGVGLCQWGAYFMSKKGHSAEEILKYYYPGAELETIKF